MSLRFCGNRIVLSALIFIARQALFFLKEFVSLSLEQDSFYFSVGEKKNLSVCHYLVHFIIIIIIIIIIIFLLIHQYL